MTEEISTQSGNTRIHVTKRGIYTSVTEIVSVHLPIPLLKKLDELVEKGYFQNRSDAMREAIRRLVRDYENPRYTFTVG
ncbi:MAG: type II toxin-antitoxin system ParD family antitoxin [Thermofilum sp.]|jgi:hypothetical protein|uniref:ribbon-helix-helix domain-containing protein n=1 Tax=Thermofilum sp. TaxID=1961369 RepID=UPI0025831DAA|nr:ribbon-helix-helix domain-containing protein [Thermofilum sp.]MCI4408770.1 type II toxin-antitoxin system ParD family antitoxin [Thermofilum sp.]